MSRSFVFFLLVITVASNSVAQSPTLSVAVSPEISLPLGETSQVLAIGGGGGLGIEYAFAGKLQPFVRADLGYTLNPIRAQTSLSTIFGAAGGGVRLWLGPRIALEAFGEGGYYHGILNDGSGNAGHAVVRGGLGLGFLLSSAFDLGARAAYRMDLGLAHLLEVSLFTTLHLSGREDRQRSIDESNASGPALLPPIPGRGLRIDNLELTEVFPVFHTYYDDHPLGTLEIVNLESKPIEGAKLSFNVPQFMEAPKEALLPPTLEPGKRLGVEINALFTDQILAVTEATKVAAELSLEYTMDGKRYGETTNVTLRLFDRNATIWDDDRRAAAFITAKDPAILSLAKNVAGVVRNAGPEAMDRNMVVAMGLFGALDLAGVNYVIDPKTPFAEFSKSATSVDYLQFPRQTLEYRAGDCDDLSVLYAAMLESVGIETAFITVPGHIYLAFLADLTPADAAKVFSSPTELILKEQKVWVPVEVTIRRAGFMQAWTEGAREWREATDSGAGALIPVHEAWARYEPVALPGSSPGMPAPSNDAILASLLREVAKYVDREMAPKVAEIEKSMRADGATSALLNRLGILYARYGRLDEAIVQFEKATVSREFAPALVNLGNAFAKRPDWKAAGTYYERASKLRPRDPAVLVGLAKTYHATEQFDRARATYAQLAAVDKALAERFAYLGGGASTEGRAAEAGETESVVLWAE